MFRWWDESIYLSRYLASGLLNTFSGFTVIFILVWMGVSAFWANLAGYLLGFMSGFILNKKIVFRSNGQLVAESIRYLLAFLLAFLANLAVLYVTLKIMKIPVMIAQILAAACYTLLMYLLSRLFVFALPKQARIQG